MACGCQCPGYQGFPGYIQSQCDCELDCWRTTFETEEEYQACMAACTPARATCQDPCTPDQSAAIASAEACREGCEDTRATCEGSCYTVEDSCQDFCLTLEGVPAQTACLTDCLLARLTCVDDCIPPWAVCLHGCDAAFLADTKAGTVASIACQAPCCAADTEHISHCLAECNTTALEDSLTAQIAFLSCASAFVENYTTVGPSPSYYYGEGVDICYDTLSIENQRIAGESMSCAYECHRKFRQERGICDTYTTAEFGAMVVDDLFTTCGHDCYETYQADELACWTAYVGDDDAQGLALCRDARDFARWTCELDCCFQLRGSDAYSRPLKDCKEAARSCTTAAWIACAALQTAATDAGATDLGSTPEDGCASLFPDPEGVCADPGSDDCLAAIEAYSDCLAAVAAYQACSIPSTEACSAALEACLDALPEAPACSRCRDLVEGFF